MSIDIERQTVTSASGAQYAFPIVELPHLAPADLVAARERLGPVALVGDRVVAQQLRSFVAWVACCK